MNYKKKRHLLKHFFIMILAAHSGCGFGTFITTSDVPCVNLIEWNSIGTSFFLQPEFEGSKNLLFMYQSLEDIEIDNADGQRDFQPRKPIYHFDSSTENFSIVEDEAWDIANTDNVRCAPINLVSPFTINPEGLLVFDNQEIQITGSTILSISSAPNDVGLIVRAAAILSTDGFMVRKFIIFPSTRATGQHYHQLFSEITGLPLGPPLRIGIGGLDQFGIFECWTLDKKYVIYAEIASGENGFSKICVVDVEDEIQQVLGN